MQRLACVRVRDLQRPLSGSAGNQVLGLARLAARITSPRPLSSFAATEARKFQPHVPVAEAVTPPASWYTAAEMQQLEKETVFRRSWIPVARADQLQNKGDHVTGSVLGETFLLAHDGEGIRAFFNVCRHHGAELCNAPCGGEGLDRFRCPYHGWEYRLDGRLIKATHLRGIKNFRAKNYGLNTIPFDVWAGVVFLHLGQGRENAHLPCVPSGGDYKSGGETTGDGRANALPSLPPPSVQMHQLEQDAMRRGLSLTTGLQFVEQRTYELACNWKVFADNYLDGGYHVSVLHEELAARVDMDSYVTTLHERHSTQDVSAGGEDARLGHGATYVFQYPNIMYNRYGDILDINIVYPVAPDKCTVVFNYFFTPDAAADPAFVASSLASSHQVQLEDQFICEAVQRGLSSSGYGVGRYAPSLEAGMHQFHRLLHADFVHGANANCTH